MDPECPLIEGKSLHVSHFFSFRVISHLNTPTADFNSPQPQLSLSLNSRIGDKDHPRKVSGHFVFVFVFVLFLTKYLEIFDFIGTNWSMGQAFLYPQNVIFYAMNDHR